MLPPTRAPTRVCAFPLEYVTSRMIWNCSLRVMRSARGPHASYYNDRARDSARSKPAFSAGCIQPAFVIPSGGGSGTAARQILLQQILERRAVGSTRSQFCSIQQPDAELVIGQRLHLLNAVRRHDGRTMDAQEARRVEPLFQVLQCLAHEVRF